MDFAGRKLIVETGKLAEQANGSVLIRYGDTTVFVAATASKEPREGIDFFPLSVDFEEKLYAVGKIPGGFIKREGKPTEKAILTSRLIDRPIRPLFPKGYRNDVQVVAMPLSVEPDVPPDVLAMVGASAALSISDIPFEGPIGSVLVGLVDDELVVNPDAAQREKSILHLTVAGTKDAIMMVEAGANEVPEDKILEAIMFGHEYIKQLVEFQEQIVAEVGVPKNIPELHKVDPEIEAAVREYAFDMIAQAVRSPNKQGRDDQMDKVEEDVLAHFAETFPEHEADISEAIYNISKECVRKMVLTEGSRPDGRKLDEIRPISCEVGLIPRVHGSGLFTRGQTQVLTIATLGAPGDEQMLEDLSLEESKRYIHHYNMPPYSTGEAKMMRGPGRREIGHGALAARALEPMIPSQEEFPYTIRVVSEVMSSNGSTSQASVCGSTLALMDAGVPIKAPVAGVAMGLMKDEESGKVAILTDIQGLEDFFGDMDFKVAGTAKGVTAIQMDIKVKGIDKPILQAALEQAYKGRMFIMDKMLEVIPEPRKELSPYAPKIMTMTIDPDKIRSVIGSGGKVINKIIADTGTKIDIEEDGTIYIAAPDTGSGQKAMRIIEGIVKDVEAGEVYLGKVTRIMPFGAFVEILPGKEGLVHISKLSNGHVDKVEDVVKVGDEILVKVTDIDKQGRINLSHKAVLGSENDKEHPKDKWDKNRKNTNS